MICRACRDGEHSGCAEVACACGECIVWIPAPSAACRACGGSGCDVDEGERVQTGAHSSTYDGGGVVACSRCQGSGRELADLMSVDRVRGTHGGQ